MKDYNVCMMLYASFSFRCIKKLRKPSYLDKGDMFVLRPTTLANVGRWMIASREYSYIKV